MSMERWFEQRNSATDRLENAHMRALTAEYKKANRSVRSQLEKYHRKYAVKGKLTYAEMTKYNRLANLEKDINKELGRLSGIVTRNTKTLAGDVYQESYFRTAFALEKESQLKLGFGQLSPNTVQRAIENPYREIALNANKERVREQVKRAVTQGLIEGEAYTETASRVQDALESNLNNAERIARTEGHRAREVAALDSMEHAEKMGVKMKKRWVATLDGRTRDGHGELDGTEIPVDDDFESPEGGRGPAPGELNNAEDDINCRCTTIAVIEGYEPEKRRIRDEGAVKDKDGKIVRYDAVPQRSYSEWKRDKEI